MAGASHLSTIAFLALVALVMGLFTFAMRRASPAPGAPGRTAHSRALILVQAALLGHLLVFRKLRSQSLRDL